jgi:hypothetical protein
VGKKAVFLSENIHSVKERYVLKNPTYIAVSVVTCGEVAAVFNPHTMKR